MTRVERAGAGEITEEIRMVAKQEGVDPESLRARIAAGTVVIVRNAKRGIKPLAIGAGTRIKVNANIGTSPSRVDLENEIAKLLMAVEHGADAVMDLSTGGDIPSIRRELLAECPLAFGTVPLYEMVQVARDAKKSVLELTPDEMFGVIEEHCRQGVDFLTLHCGVTRRTVDRFKEVGRMAGAVSRGGTIMMEWIHHNNRENPLYEQYDRLLDILSVHDVAVSLGDGFRPGALKDATDRVQIEELTVLGELVKRARARGVGVFVEGPGHVPLDQVAANIQIEKTLCDNAPFYVLGPLVTDVSPGYDHIAGAIGGAVAGMAGADFLCYVTPAEHLRLPSVEDVREGVIASRIAAHAADVGRHHPGAMEWDNTISAAKMRLDWEQILSLCIDPPKARAYRESLPPGDESNLCSMCGEYCAVRRSQQVK
ncbi:MAG: phosphomethylpyrimidine synthase ThiC [Chitinivibrionales bacterium]|nr:phosphomethylpyrimidine synthase ThiC [Chitinivibrionales bacterium]MBD3358584.1 phosphomethylpyrimidine synthase ThiC [Chitinivibrionales bacterium]